MKPKKIAAASVAATVALAFAVMAPAMPTVAASPDMGASQSQASGSDQGGAPGRHGPHHGFGAMTELSKITGMTEQQLAEKYPQKTAWQIAKTLGKLDELKKAFLATHKQTLDSLVKEGRLTGDQAAKIYDDLAKRVAAVDGVNTVILGRPQTRAGQ